MTLQVKVLSRDGVVYKALFVSLGPGGIGILKPINEAAGAAPTTESPAVVTTPTEPPTESPAAVTAPVPV